MIKEQGLFSNRYLMRRGKENHNHHNVAHRHGDEIDFPLALTSAKVISKQRNSISVKKVKNEEKKNETKVKEEEEGKISQIVKLQKQLREAKDQLRKVNKDMQSKTIQYQNYINELTNELKQKDETITRQSSKIKEEAKRVSLQTASSQRYAQTIKNQIYWLLNIFMKLQETHFPLDSLKDQVSNNFLSFKAYIQQFDIEKQLQQLAQTSSRNHVQQTSILEASSILKLQKNVPKKINTDSMFTEDMQELNMIKIMELHPLIETFNNQQHFAEEGNQIQQSSNDKMERITKKLFDDSPLFKQYGGSSNVSVSVVSNSKQLGSREKEEQQNGGDMDLPREVMVVTDFVPDEGQQNFISLTSGEVLKLLRKVRDKLWIGEFKQKIGLVLENSFRLQ